jgi:hypothetical protein
MVVQGKTGYSASLCWGSLPLLVLLAGGEAKRCSSAALVLVTMLGDQERWAVYNTFALPPRPASAAFCNAAPSSISETLLQFCSTAAGYCCSAAAAVTAVIQVLEG